MSRAVTILFSTKYKDNVEEIKNKLLWYDPVFKEMKKIEGGRLGFEYREDEDLIKIGYSNPYRMVPKIEPVYKKIKTKSSDEREIIKWFDDFQNYRESNSTIVMKTKEGIEFNVPDNEIDEFLYDCERRNFTVRF